MNKFLNRSVKGKSKKETSSMGREKDLSILQEFQYCWDSLDKARRKARRSFMYTYGNQWGDLIKDPDTEDMITEEDFIKKQGKVPLKNNVIAPIVNNIDGQFRSTTTKPVCVVHDPDERKIGEMMSMAVEYIHDINEMQELDADALRKELCAGIVAQRIEYGINPSKHKKDVWVYPINTFRVFFNTNIEDPRAWDITHIGELIDLPLYKIKALFAKNESDKEWLDEIYGKYQTEYLHSNGLQGEENRSLVFNIASRPDMCRVIFGWKLVTEDRYYWHDSLDGTWGFAPYTSNQKKIFEAENQRRMDDATANGVDPEDVLLIEFEYKMESFWKYWYLSPYGHVLQSGRSPFWHHEHNYVINTYPMINGQVYNFVEQFIDQQRVINRTATLIDFVRSASSKGLLVCDDTAFEGMSREEIIDEYVRYNGVLFVKLKQGQNIQEVIHQVNSNVSFANDFELLNLQLKLINDISGVNNAMQGKDVKSSTPSSLFAQQTQNASNNIRGVFDNFKAFRRRRDTKIMKTAQQYYNEKKYLDLGGKDYSEEAKWYDPEKVQNSEIDLSIVDGGNTPAYQLLENETLKDLFDRQVIDATMYLENSTLPFAPRILESIKKNQEELAKAQQMQGISPELVQQAQQASGNPQLMQQLYNGAPSAADGIVMRPQP